jgi:cytochrome c biogenesis protein CcdA
MMDGFLAGSLTALWLGILTSISPCPMASNIAAVSFLGRNLEKNRAVLLAGVFYTLGRTASYLILGIIIVSGVLSVPSIAWFLQDSMNRILGPVLILVGIVLLEMVRIPMPTFGGGDRIQRIAQSGGIWGSGLIGMVFALSFCPISAALFFGSLLTLSIQHESRLLYPALYGVGTGLPVVVFSILIAFGAASVAKAFDKISRFEWWARRITGIIFILVGIYYILTYIFGISIWNILGRGL